MAVLMYKMCFLTHLSHRNTIISPGTAFILRTVEENKLTYNEGGCPPADTSVSAVVDTRIYYGRSRVTCPHRRRRNTYSCPP